MNNATLARPIEILLVEDNAGDIELTREAFKEGRVNNQLHIIRDGADALLFLNKGGPHHNAPTPDLILLDLNLPKRDGREVLAEIKGNGDLKRIPVVVLTTSRAEEDVLKSYNLNANCYITKPIDFDRFNEAVRSIEHFWFKIVTLPSDQKYD